MLPLICRQQLTQINPLCGVIIKMRQVLDQAQWLVQDYLFDFTSFCKHQVIKRPEYPMTREELFDDTENPEHSPTERAAAAFRSTWVSVGVNLVLTLCQIVAGILSSSQGLIADGVAEICGGNSRACSHERDA
ncbi:hypothetical protein PSAC2689_100113 [Paraburkholderia sacchari]